MPEFSIEVENYPLRFFATTIGDLDPIRHDEAAARAAGYRSLVAPPTYVSCLINMADPDPEGLLHLLEIDLKRVLHGEQQITYHQPICAGDRLFFQTRIADIYDRKNGALEFVVLQTQVSNQERVKVAETSTTMVVRNAA